MKQIRFSLMVLVSLFMGATVLTSCGASGAAGKQKGIVLQEGDRATLLNENGYTTIVFPDKITSDDMAIYDTDFRGYLLKSNAPIDNSGNQYDSYGIYYYLHNSKEWLHQGIYENPYEMQISRIKSIKIANDRMRLREFNEQMPLLNNSKEKKSDQGYQDEIMFGNSYYIFIDITMRD